MHFKVYFNTLIKYAKFAHILFNTSKYIILTQSYYLPLIIIYNMLIKNFL